MREHNDNHRPEDNRRPEEIEDDIARTRAEVSSTIDAIQSKLTPGQMMDQAFAYARTSLPADFGANLGNTIRDNPVPVALIGVGIAWLAMQGQHSGAQPRMRRRTRSYEDDYDAELYGAGVSSGSEYTGSSEGRVHRVVSKVGSKGRDMKDRASEAGQTISNKASEAGQAISNKASEAGQAISEKASELGQRVSNATSSMVGQARDTMHGARDRMSGTAGNARARASDLSHRSQDQYYRAKDSFSRLIDEQPLILGALGAAIGTLLGAALPSTRHEDRLMGKTRDSMLDSAKELAREKSETLKESAQRVAKTAEQEIKTATSNGAGSQAGSNGHTDPASRTGVADPSKLGDTTGSKSLH